jgi:hypothetical protein
MDDRMNQDDMDEENYPNGVVIALVLGCKEAVMTVCVNCILYFIK